MAKPHLAEHVLPGPVDLPGSLQGGQAFRWTTEGSAFHGVVGGHATRLTPAGAGVRAQVHPEADAKLIETYLRLEPPQARMRERLAADPVLAPAVAAHPGLRLLRQDPWETTVAFLTSANNNVLRIERILHALAKRYGEPLATPAEWPGTFHAFPPPERLARASETSLRGLGLGYRAPFLRESARMVARGDVDLAALRGAGREEAREALLQLPGVGPKVADCIALFSLDVDDAFPIDRWILRAMSDLFFEGTAQAPRTVEAFARDRWGRDVGLAQQYIFHAVRLAAKAPGTTRLAR